MFKLCAPALIYLCFSMIQIIIDMFKQLYQEALYKLVAMILITLLLNILCEQNLELVAWIIVLTPFILMTEMIIMLAYIFGINKGNINYKDQKQVQSSSIIPKVTYAFNQGSTYSQESKTPPMTSSSPAYQYW